MFPEYEADHIGQAAQEHKFLNSRTDPFSEAFVSVKKNVDARINAPGSCAGHAVRHSASLATR